MGRIKQQQEEQEQEQTPISKKAKKAPSKRPVRRRDEEEDDDEEPPTHKRGRQGQQHQHDDDSSSDSGASASESDSCSSSDDDGAGKQKKAPRSFTWHKGKGGKTTTTKQRPGGRKKLAVSSSEEEDEVSTSGGSGSESEGDSLTPARRRMALGSRGGSSTKGKKGAKGGGRKQQRQAEAEEECESDGTAMGVDSESEDEEEGETVVIVARKLKSKGGKGKASGKKGAAGAVTPLLLPLSDEEEEEVVKKTKGEKTGSKRKAPAAAGSKGKKEQKTGKKAKKTKAAAPGGEEGEQLSAIEQLCGNAELFNHLFLATSIIGSAADVVHLGSTCKAFGELRAAPSVVEIDLKEASNTLRFPNRFIRSLARPGNRLEVLSVKNAFTGEMCRNLSEVLTSGQLPHLEELECIQGCEALGGTFSSLVSADLPSLRHLGLKHTKIAAEHYKPLTEKSKALSNPAPRKRTLGLKRKKAAKVATGPLLSLEGLSLINLKIPDTALVAWVQGLASNRAPLQHLELVGVLPNGYHQVTEAIKDGSFPHLHTLVLDNRRLGSTDAAALIHGCGAHLHGLRTLVLANKQGKLGHYYGANHGASAAAIVKALEEEAADEDSALQALESLSIGWGVDHEAIDAFLTLIFEGVAYGVKGGDGDKTTKKKRKKAKTLPFPNLTSIGLIEMAGTVHTEGAKKVIEHALRRGITTVDFSFNELAASDVGEVVQHASDLLLRAAAAHHHPGQAPSLFLQMRQFSRRWKSGYRHHNRWMVARRQLRKYLDSVLKALPDDLAEGLEVDIGESETREHDA